MSEEASEAGKWSIEELPRSWEWRNFFIVFDNVTSSDLKLKQKEYVKSGTLPVVDQGQELTGGYTDKKDLTHPSEPPVILFGDHTQCVKYLDFPFVQGADGTKILKATECVLPKFAYWSLRTIELPKKGYSRHFKFLRISKFPIPPLAEQRRIVAKIEALQKRSRKAREALAEVKPLLEQFRQSLLAAAFRGDLTADWREQHPDIEPASELLARIRQERRKKWEQTELAKYEVKGKKPPKGWQERYKEPEPVDDTELPELPDGWCWTTLLTISEIQSGITLGQKKRDHYIYELVPYLRVANVQRGYLDLSEVKEVEVTRERAKELQLLNGDLLFNEGGDRDKLGRGCVWHGKMERCIHQNHVYRARLVLPELIPELISHYTNEFGRDYFFQNASQSVNLASINKTQLSGLPVPLVPCEEQLAILELLNTAFSFVDSIEESFMQSGSDLTQLDQAILAKAFRGELVPQDPNDEPASVLLERIRRQREANKNGQPKRKGRSKASSRTDQ